MSHTYHDIPALLRAAGELTAKDIADRMQIDLADAQHLLGQHIKAGEAERIGRGTGRPPVYAAIGAVQPSAGEFSDLKSGKSAPQIPPEDKPEVSPFETEKTQLATAKAPRRRAFSPVSLHGYHVKPDGTVTLFLDRQVSAKSITFTASQLRKMAADAERAAA